MRRFSLIFTLCLALAPLAGADEWSKAFTISGKPNLRVETSDANIRVDTWAQHTISARVTTERWKIGEKGIKINARQSGDTVELEVRFPNNINIFGFNSSGRKVDIEIHMPREGRVTLRTGDGSIRLTDLKGEAEINSGDGNQELEALDGTLRAKAGDGHIRAVGRFDALEIGTGDGRIEARALPGSQTASNWDLHAGDGSITLQVPANFAAGVELRTDDGHISTNIPLAMEGRSEQNSVRGRLNGGGNLLSIHTGDGAIRLESLR